MTRRRRRRDLTLTPERRATAEQAIEQAGLTRRLLRKASDPESRQRLNRSRVIARGDLTLGQVRHALGYEGLLVASIGLCWPRAFRRMPAEFGGAVAGLLEGSREWQGLSSENQKSHIAAAIFEVGMLRLKADVRAGLRAPSVLERRDVSEVAMLRALTDKAISSRVITRLRDTLLPHRRRPRAEGKGGSTVPTTGVDAMVPLPRDRRQAALVSAALKAMQQETSRDKKNEGVKAAEHLLSEHVDERKDEHRARLDDLYAAIVAEDEVLTTLTKLHAEKVVPGMTPGEERQAVAEARLETTRLLKIRDETITRRQKIARRLLQERLKK